MFSRGPLSQCKGQIFRVLLPNSHFLQTVSDCTTKANTFTHNNCTAIHILKTMLVYFNSTTVLGQLSKYKIVKNTVPFPCERRESLQSA